MALEPSDDELEQLANLMDFDGSGMPEVWRVIRDRVLDAAITAAKRAKSQEAAVEAIRKLKGGRN